MRIDSSSGSTISICAGLNLLMSLPFRAKGGEATVEEIITSIAVDYENQPNDEEALVHTETYLALRRMVKGNEAFRTLVVDFHTPTLGYHTDGLNAAVFTGHAGNFIAFRGTGAGEWNDNAMALLGTPQTNVYYQYNHGGQVVGAKICLEYVSTQQAQAYNYFSRVIAQKRWTENDHVIVTGHSKGGNKAQFVTLLSPIVSACYSFCGQGFAPEAVAQFQTGLGGAEYSRRCAKMRSLSSYNDFVNVMGQRVVPDDQVFYFDTIEVASTRQYHELASFVAEDGGLLPMRTRGELSRVAETLWKETLESPDRKAISMAVMTLCEHYFGNGVPINGEFISNQTFYRGGRVAMGIVVRTLAGTLLRAGKDKLSENDRSRLSAYYDTLIRPRTQSIRASSFGKVIDRAIDRIRTYSLKAEKPPQELHTGALDPYFFADSNALQLRAQQIERVRERLAVARTKILHNTAGESAREAQSTAKTLLEEDAKLARCAQFLQQTAAEFEQTDAELAALASFIFR